MSEGPRQQRIITGTKLALERVLAQELADHKARDPLAPFNILVGETVLRPYLRRRLADLAGGHLNLRILTSGDLGLALGERACLDAGREPMPFLGSRILA